MPDRVALFLQDSYPLRDAIQYVRYAETRGFEAVWQAEPRLDRDAIVALAAYAANTNRIKLGSGVVNNWTRNAATLAMSFITLDDLAQDRIICGIGAWVEGLAAQVGVRRDRPLLALREMIQVLRTLFDGQRMSFQGQFIRLDNVSIGARRIDPRVIPIYIAATSPAMMALGGEIADGVLLNYLTSPAYTANTIHQIEIGARKAGRPIDSIERPQLIVCSVDQDRTVALDRARQLVTQYLRQQPQTMKTNGVRQELLNEVMQVLPNPLDAIQVAEAARLVPDDVVQLVTAAGTPEDCKIKVREYLAAGATCPVLYPLGSDVNFMIDTFATGYT
jgi:5,10-methylenetetrahydromethanopterin reductase